MREENAKAADYECDKTGGVDPVGDANKERMTRNIQCRGTFDCEPWKADCAIAIGEKSSMGSGETQPNRSARE